MKRTYVITDWVYRLGHSIRRNKIVVALYALICVLFLVVGIAVGVGVNDKHTFILNNGAPIFKFLRGGIGIFTFFIFDFVLISVYTVFAASVFFYKPLAFLSLVPCAYRAYVLGLNVSIIVVVFTVSALPMLFVLYVPICLIEIVVVCFASFGCFKFNALNCGCMPSRVDVKQYYVGVLQYIIILAACVLVKTITLGLFGSSLVGII
ncbi:MAG: hypothetical protein HDT28_06970 [Clostridiales bacterium]|nr:hypothetical protein [Clostridiales bacterium]